MLSPPPEHAPRLPFGVLLDDWLELEARLAVDRQAADRLAEWRVRRDPALTIEGLCLPYVHEVELFVDVFLPELRIIEGLRSRGTSLGSQALALHGVDGLRARCLSRTLDADVDEGAEQVNAPAYPLAFPRPAAGPADVLRGWLGVPGLPRGNALFQPYRHLPSLLGALADHPQAVPVIDPAHPASRPGATLLRIAGRGGWVSYPGPPARAGSRRRLEQALASARAQPWPDDDPVGALLDLRALELLEAVGEHASARFVSYRRAFSGGRLRTALLPSDSSPDGRMITTAARTAGKDTVHVQHGFFGYRPQTPWPATDGFTAGTVTSWSERDAAYVRAHRAARVVTTGNPGAPTPRPLRTNRPEHTLILVQVPSLPSLVLDLRATFSHLEMALSALAAVRPHSTATIRPHPLDTERRAYLDLAARTPRLAVCVDSSGSFEHALGHCDLCIGAISTATLEAPVLGVPTILLAPWSLSLQWPFGRDDPFPVARSEEGLRQCIALSLEARLESTADVAAEALGARPDAVHRVADVIGAAASKP